VLQSEL